MEFINAYDLISFSNKIMTETSIDKVMSLSIFIDSNDDKLKNMYLEYASKHNDKIMNDPHFYDAGFDLFLPKDELNLGYTNFFCAIPNISCNINKVDFKVKCCAKIVTKNNSYFTPFYTYARSSMSKTPLRLANNQGIIDAGYRGPLIGMFDCIYSSGKYIDGKWRMYDWKMDDYSRMLQICAPGLIPIHVQIVDKFEDLGPSTSRGDGGFGSTGK
jgi:dUTP pyrophosphatase